MKNLLKVFFIIITLITLSLNLFSKENLIAYWHFDNGDAKDYSGNGYDGTLMNGPRLVTGYNSKGLAYYFQGYDTNDPQGSHILLSYIDFYKIPEFTVMLWAKFEGLSHEAGEAYLFFGDHERGWLGIMNHVKQPEYDGILFIQFSVGSNLYSGNAAVKPIEVKLKKNDLNKWVHYAMTFKNDTMKAYINGVLVGSKYQRLNIVGNKAAIARHWWAGDLSSTRLFGTIDEVKIYNRAFKEDEILHSCDETKFDYANFSNPVKLDFSGEATIKNDAIELTPSKLWVAGSVWRENKMPVKKGFTTEFTFQCLDGHESNDLIEKYPGADGIVFVIQNDSRFAIGRNGGGIGYSGISNSIAIKIDTYFNDGLGDPNESHVAVFSMGEKPNSANHNGPGNLKTSNIDLDIKPDGTLYVCKILYDGEKSNLKVYLNKKNEEDILILSLNNFKIDSLINLTQDEFAWVGFTSATGIAYEQQNIINWSFCPEPTDAVLSVDDDIITDKQIIENFSIYPNPFETNLNINFNLNKNSNVSFIIYDLLGNKVKTLINERKNSGYYNIIWNGMNDNNKAVEQGIYYYRLLINNNINCGTIVYK